MERLKRTFTLVELIMVMVIVSIAMSMLLPALANAKNKVRQAQCMSNLRQICMGVAEYSDAFDGFSPPPELANPYGHFLNYLFVDVFEKNAKPLQCPSVDDDESFNPYGGSGVFGTLKHASYIMNAIREKDVAGWSHIGARITTPYPHAFGWCGNNTRTPVRKNLSPSPSNKIQITDASKGLTNSSTAIGILRLHETDHGMLDANNNSIVNAGERQVGYQHDFKFSALFGDLHGEARKSSTHEEWNAIQK